MVARNAQRHSKRLNLILVLNLFVVAICIRVYGVMRDYKCSMTAPVKSCVLALPPMSAVRTLPS